MAKLNFSLPDEVKQEFNELFANENKSAVLTRLIVQAIEAKRQDQRRKAAVDRILAMRETASATSTEEILATLHEMRP